MDGRGVMSLARTGERVLSLLVGLFCAAVAWAAAQAPEKAPPVPPQTALIKTLQKEYEPVLFDHKNHATAAKTCSSCHHHTSAEETRKCASCHDLEKMAGKETLREGFLACKSCHRKYNPADPSMPGLLTAYHLQCFSCHKEKDRIAGPKACAVKCHPPMAKMKGK